MESPQEIWSEGWVTTTTFSFLLNRIPNDIQTHKNGERKNPFTFFLPSKGRDCQDKTSFGTFK